MPSTGNRHQQRRMPAAVVAAEIDDYGAMEHNGSRQKLLADPKPRCVMIVPQQLLQTRYSLAGRTGRADDPVRDRHDRLRAVRRVVLAGAISRRFASKIVRRRAIHSTSSCRTRNWVFITRRPQPPTTSNARRLLGDFYRSISFHHSATFSFVAGMRWRRRSPPQSALA